MSSCRSMGVIRPEMSKHEQKVDFAPASPIVSKVIDSKVIELPETTKEPENQKMLIFRKHNQHMSSCRSMGVIRPEISTHEQKVDFWSPNTDVTQHRLKCESVRLTWRGNTEKRFSRSVLGPHTFPADLRLCKAHKELVGYLRRRIFHHGPRIGTIWRVASTRHRHDLARA